MEKYEAVIGLEVHAELQTESKMFCSCPVVDNTKADPNIAVCPVCLGLPGVLPVVNEMAVEYGMKVALALECTINQTSIFARKNYFYPDLPKGYQISQFEYPLAENGRLMIYTSEGEKVIRIRRVHLEEDAGKLTHVEKDGEKYSLVDLNRAGVALLEIVSEPDIRSIEEMRAYATELHAVIKALGVNSADMSKGVLRFEANVSIRPKGSQELGTRVEIKNLNSFKAMERAVIYQIEQQIQKVENGLSVDQETLGWDTDNQVTYSQRSKEEAHDYRYFPEPDLPPLVVEPKWINRVRQELPELPRARRQRFIKDYALSEADAELLGRNADIANYFEECISLAGEIEVKQIANWMTGGLFNWMNLNNAEIKDIRLTPQSFIEILQMLQSDRINSNSAKVLLDAVLESGESAQALAEKMGLQQIKNEDLISSWVSGVLEEHPEELAAFLDGKETLQNWFFGQVMRIAKGKASPVIIKKELENQLKKYKKL